MATPTRLWKVVLPDPLEHRETALGIQVSFSLSLFFFLFFQYLYESVLRILCGFSMQLLALRDCLEARAFLQHIGLSHSATGIGKCQ